MKVSMVYFFCPSYKLKLVTHSSTQSQEAHLLPHYTIHFGLHECFKDISKEAFPIQVPFQNN